MNYITPEKAGISSKNIKKYIEKLEKNRLSTHDIIMMKGNDIFFEKYWEPFHKDFLHRMYSVTKSFVSIAIGFLEQDGKVNLDDEIEKYFPEETKTCKIEGLKKQTVRDMLKMSTTRAEGYYFDAKPSDRVKFYFENEGKTARPSNTIFNYDSSGSFILGALVERVSGMELVEYLKVKLFDKIGVSEDTYCLKCPGGHAWSDSALIMKPIDLLKVARFTMNKGTWNGERILNEEYLTLATTKQLDNNVNGLYDYKTQGYGYYFWMCYDNSYFFNGMGDQIALCVPEKDLIMVYNADNQGKDYSRRTVINTFFDLIVDEISDEPLEENAADLKALNEYTAGLKLAVAIGEKTNPIKEKINGVTYAMGENPMGISKIKLTFDKDGGVFAYTNEQGDKEIEFGMCENRFGIFPQDGYSDMYGSMAAPGNKYKCAASAAWVDANKLFIKVQVIDKYFGNLNITLGFKDDEIGVRMGKTAEDFMREYDGFAGGKAI